MNLVSAIATRSLAYATVVAQAHAIGSMNSLVTVTRDGSYDTGLREYDPELREVLYDAWDDAGDPTGDGAIAGVSTAEGPSTLSLGDEPQYYSSITVYLPRSGAKKSIRIDDTVLVVTSPDPDIDGRFFRVTGVPAGGRLYASNTLHCTGIAPSKQWSSP